MSDFWFKSAEQVIASEGYLKASGLLFEVYVSNLASLQFKDKLNRKEIKKLISSAQIFFLSNDQKFRREGGEVLSMLLDIYIQINIKT